MQERPNKSETLWQAPPAKYNNKNEVQKNLRLQDKTDAQNNTGRDTGT